MKGQKSRHRRDWVSIVKAWEESGQTVKDFCGQNSIYTSDFYRHRKRVKNGHQRLVKIEPVKEQQSNMIIVETPNRYRILIQNRVDPDLLGGVLTVLEQRR